LKNGVAVSTWSLEIAQNPPNKDAIRHSQIVRRERHKERLYSEKAYFFLVLVLVFTACSGSKAAKGQRLKGPTDSFKFTVISSGTAYSVSKGTAIEGTVNIPGYYRPNAISDYLPVTEIGSFQGYKNIIKINIPSTVTSIGKGALSNCTGLTSITMTNNYFKLTHPDVMIEFTKIPTESFPDASIVGQDGNCSE